MLELTDIVGSRGKAEVLRLLFGIAQPELHLRELTRQSGLSLGTMQQELRRSCRAGLVVARRDGNRMYFKAQATHPLYPELRGLVLKTCGLAGCLAEALNVPEVALAFVFGSFARAEAGAESDVDLMVIGTIGLRRLSQLLSGLPDKLGREINPHALIAEEFRAKKQRREHFISTVLAGPKLFVKGTPDELEAMGR